MCSPLFSSLPMLVGPNKNKYQENVSANNMYLQYSRSRDANTLCVVVKLVPDSSTELLLCYYTYFL